MSSVRDTFERNVEGLNDLFLQYKMEIENAISNMLNTGSYEDALKYIDQKIFNVILEFGKRKSSVSQILQTKLKLSFDDKNQGVIAEWDDAISNVISKIEMLGSTLKEDVSKTVTETIRIPAIGQFLIDAANRKAFTRLTFDFIAKKLDVPVNKVEEVAENLIFEGKLPARMDLVSRTLIFADVIEKMEAPVSGPTSPTQPAPSILPAPKPPSLSKVPSPEEGPQPIELDTPIDGPQPIDLSLEPPEPDITESMLETPPDSIEFPPDVDFSETIDLSSPTAPDSPPVQTPSQVEESQIATPGMSDEEKEARTIISFFKSSVSELSEEDRAEARRIREEKRKKLMAKKKKKEEEEKKKKSEAPTPLDLKGEPAGDVSAARADLQSLIAPKPEVKAATGVTCIICNNPILKGDPTVIPCPHACGAHAHKKELLDKGYCPNCNEEVTESDIEFSSLL